MKLIVCSDSHGNIRNMKEIVAKERPDKLLHLGDTAHDAEQLRMMLPRLPIISVPGNCDGLGSLSPAERLIEEGGVRIFMLHGHTAQVKSGYGIAVQKAQNAGADVLLFGHTHRQLYMREGALQLMNPGSTRAGDYGILSITDGGAVCELATLWDDTKH